MLEGARQRGCAGSCLFFANKVDIGDWGREMTTLDHQTSKTLFKTALNQMTHLERSLDSNMIIKCTMKLSDY